VNVSTDGTALVRWTRVLLVLTVLFGLLTLAGSLYYAFGMDSDSEALFRMAQAACFTTEGPEFVERCAPLTRATVDGEMNAFVSAIGLVSWTAALALAGLSLGLLLRRPAAGASPLLPRWAAWTFVVLCGWLLLAPLDKLWDEAYAEGTASPAVGVLSQYLPGVIGESSARVWLGSSGAAASAAGQIVNQAVMMWAVAMLVVALLWLRRPPAPAPPPAPTPPPPTSPSGQLSR
jgi:hypothetical protein